MEPLAQNSMVQGRYLIVQSIGSGPVGEVYLAVDQWSGSAVAIKRTPATPEIEETARSLVSVDHAVLPKVSESFVENGSHFLVMEHISGDNMERRLEDAGKPFPVSWCMFWADQVLDALNYLHSHTPRIVHGDVKPANLKLTDENHIVLLDQTLAFAKVEADNPQKGDAFTPLEQLRGEAPSPAADIYAVAATVYNLMTGVMPPDARKRSDAVRSGLPDPLGDPSKSKTGIPEQISAVILRGLELAPDRRYQTAAEMQRDLRRAYKRSKEAPAEQAPAVGTTAPTEVIQVIADEHPVDRSEAPTFVASSSGSELPTKTHYSSDAEEPEPTAILPQEQVPDVTQGDIKTEAFRSDTAASAATEVAPATPHAVPPAPDARPSAAPSAAAVPAAAMSQPPARKSRAGLIIGLLIGLLLLGVVGAGGAWFAYTRYYKAAALPSPSPTAAPSPSPSPTQDAVVETTPAATPEPLPTVDPNANKSTTSTVPVQVKPTPGTPGKTNPPRTPAPPTSKTPVKTKPSGGRTDILQ